MSSAAHDPASTDVPIYYSNVRSLVPKLNALRNYASIYKPFLIAITETWLTNDIPSSIFGLPNYVAFRKDRSFAKGGGSLLLVSSEVESKPVLLRYDSSCKVDGVACQVTLPNGESLGCLCVYRPPNSIDSDNSVMRDLIADFLKFDFQYNLVMGDFNFPEIQWPSKSSSLESSLFLNFTQENFLHQHVLSATRKGPNSILDLVFTTTGTDISNLCVNEELENSDHYSIQFSLKLNLMKTKRKITRRNLRSADWLRFQQLLSDSDWGKLGPSSDINIAWDSFLSNINAALNIVAPYRTIAIRNFISSSCVRTALRHKRRFFRQMMTHPSPDNIAAYERSVIITKKALTTDLAQRENRVLNDDNPKTFWAYVNQRLSNRVQIKSIKSSNKDIRDPKEISNAFNQYFASIFRSKHDVVLSSSSYTRVFPSLETITISVNEVWNVLKTLPSKTSTDGDGLCYKILKEGGVILATCLYHLFCLSLNVSQIPSAWKIAVVTPIHKKGPKNSVENYRPISVTSCCSRILERIIRHKVMEFINSNELLSDSQHGFRKGRSTDTLMINFYDYVTERIDSNMIIDAIFFDFAKAFDTIPHDLLINRLYTHGISGSLLKWIKHFLDNRSQTVKINTSTSNVLSVSSGVIQGSVLGPTLFNIFINDIDLSLKYCSILKYADDLRIYLSSPKNPDATADLQMKIQHDINKISDWANASGMTLNINKCFHVTFGQYLNNIPRSYSINGDIIPNIMTFDDLGMTVGTPLSFNNHIDRAVSKAFNKLGLINKVFQNKSRKSIARLYKAYIRPTLEYSSVVWNPHTIGNTTKLERVQRRMCRMIPSIHDLPYKMQLASLGMLSLKARRLRYQLISIFKMYIKTTDIELGSLFTLAKDKNTRGHNATLILKYARNNYRLHFFTISAIHLWNKLPQTLIDSTCVTQFKNGLASFFIKHDIW